MNFRDVTLYWEEAAIVCPNGKHLRCLRCFVYFLHSSWGAAHGLILIDLFGVRVLQEGDPKGRGWACMVPMSTTLSAL